MDDRQINRTPRAIAAILDDTDALGFNMASEPKVGALLAVLAASKPGGRFLELGTGTGHGTAWILAGMDAASRLDTVDTDLEVVAIAKRHLDADERVTFHIADGAEFIAKLLAGSTYADGRGNRSKRRCCVAADKSGLVFRDTRVGPGKRMQWSNDAIGRRSVPQRWPVERHHGSGHADCLYRLPR